MDAFDIFKNISKTNKEKLKIKDCSNSDSELKNEDECFKGGRNSREIKEKCVVKNRNEINIKEYICRNCGNMQDISGQGKGCAVDFFQVALFFTIIISLIVPILWFAVAFEILFLILSSNSIKKNYCWSCKASDCIVPLNSPAGETIFKDFYKEENINELKQKLIIENNMKSSKGIWIAIAVIIFYFLLVFLSFVTS